MFRVLGSIWYKLFYMCMQNGQKLAIWTEGISIFTFRLEIYQYLFCHRFLWRTHTFPMNAPPCAASYVKREWRKYLKCLRPFSTQMPKALAHAQKSAVPRAFLWSPDCIQFFLLCFFFCSCCRWSRVLTIFYILAIMPVGIKSCSNCSQQNNYRRQVCVKCGVSLSHSRGRPTGTTQEAGYGVSGGRPSGTTQEADYSVPHSRRRDIQFHELITLPEEWDHSEEMVNVSASLLDVCSCRIAQQRTFDKKPLGVKCVLWVWTHVELCWWFPHLPYE